MTCGWTAWLRLQRATPFAFCRKRRERVRRRREEMSWSERARDTVQLWLRAHSNDVRHVADQMRSCQPRHSTGQHRGRTASAHSAVSATTGCSVDTMRVTPGPSGRGHAAGRGVSATRIVLGCYNICRPTRVSIVARAIQSCSSSTTYGARSMTPWRVCCAITSGGGSPRKLTSAPSYALTVIAA